MSRDTLICLALGCLTLLLYAPVRHHQFVNYDDPGYVQEEHVRQGLTADNVRWAFTTFQFSNYHPLTWLSHMADVTMFGLDNPGGHHLVSVVIHAINAVLLYLVLRSATGKAIASAIVAVMWAAHPLRVESVAWAAERKDVLSGMFFLLTLACYVRSAGRRSRLAYAASLVCFALGLLSKSMLVTTPFVLLLIDFWPLKRPARWKVLLVEKLPFFALTLAFIVLTILAQRQGGAMAATEHYPLGLRIGNAFAALASYVRQTFWPTRLAVFYPYYGAIEGTRLSVVAVSTGVAIALAGLAGGLALWRRERAMLIGVLWFVGTLVPVIGLVQVGRQSMADRYTYIPQMGLFVAMVWAVCAALQALPSKLARPLIGFAIVAVVALSLRTHDQLRHWRDSGALFEHAMRVTARNPVAHANLAMYRIEQNDLNGALQLLLKAIEIVPNESGPYYHAARVLAQLGRHDEAVGYFEKSLEREPDSFVAHYDLAVELAERGRPADALPHFEQALRIMPESPQAHYAYSLALSQAGRRDASAGAYQRYVDLARRRGLQPLPIPTTNPDNR